MTTAIKKKAESDKITPLKAYMLMKKSGGKIFTVRFIKKDGTRRTMNCRLGVSKGITGKGMSFDPETREKMVVFDVKANQYRMINLDTVLKLKIEGKIYNVSRFA